MYRRVLPLLLPAVLLLSGCTAGQKNMHVCKSSDVLCTSVSPLTCCARL